VKTWSKDVTVLSWSPCAPARPSSLFPPARLALSREHARNRSSVPVKGEREREEEESSSEHAAHLTQEGRPPPAYYCYYGPERRELPCHVDIVVLFVHGRLPGARGRGRIGLPRHLLPLPRAHVRRRSDGAGPAPVPLIVRCVRFRRSPIDLVLWHACFSPLANGNSHVFQMAALSSQMSGGAGGRRFRGGGNPRSGCGSRPTSWTMRAPRARPGRPAAGPRRRSGLCRPTGRRSTAACSATALRTGPRAPTDPRLRRPPWFRQ
jgi:hypothetical protein